MRRKKKTITLKADSYLIGFGHNTAIKYKVIEPHPKGGWYIATEGESSVSRFHYKSDTFTDGNTLYKNGLRCYIYNNVKDRQWQAIKSRQSVLLKLKQLMAVVDYTKKASDARILNVDVLLDNFFEGYRNLRRRKNGKKN